ncbi:HAD-superfamily hydrolase [Pseudomonas syringae pv. actinidiae ICMP 18804]|nr:HAD-superfamily hydrolase [Pseudomonas syringae pv. actinidiae ICMP 18804]
MRLALFDLDNTLLGGDSDHAWGDYLCQRGILDADTYKSRNDEFYQDYLAGTLNMTDYLNFTLEILGNTDMAQLQEWHREFMRDCIEPIMLPKALELIAKHREAGDKLVVITATNRFVTAPIVARLGIETLLATECEMLDGDNAFSLEDSYFYSDSMNDLPLLEQVANPVAVDPDAKLRAEAEQRGWPVITLRS